MSPRPLADVFSRWAAPLTPWPRRASGAYGTGQIDIEELHKIECVSLPGSGTCSAMFTANTMSSAVEALGMALPGSAAHPVVVP